MPRACGRALFCGMRGHAPCFCSSVVTTAREVTMTQHLSALFRSGRDAQDAQRALTETMRDAFEVIFLFEMGCRATLQSTSWTDHEIEFAEYAGHGEQLTTAGGNRFPQPCDHQHSSFRIGENEKTGHTLLVVSGPDTSQIPTICQVIAQCNAFALHCPDSRWRLCNTLR